VYTKFGVDSLSRFPVTAWTDRQTEKQTRLNALHTPAAMSAWVINRSRTANAISELFQQLTGRHANENAL